MEPIYFNAGERRLFGIYHPPRGDLARHMGIILCNPMGREYIRSHRAFLRLAQRLCAAGFHCLRFDYFGTGDSCGDSSQGGIEQWTRDIGSAIDELSTGAGTQSVCLIGLRLGATLAALAGAQRSDVSHLVLWDPVLHGVSYLDELKTHHRNWLRTSPACRSRLDEQGDAQEALGFPLTDQLKTGIRGLDLMGLTARPADRILLLVTSKEAPVRPLLTHYRQLGIATDHRLILVPSVWHASKSDTRAPLCLVPNDALSTVVTWLTEAES